MQYQREDLVNSLPKHGWEIVEVEIPNREIWHRDWADEIITIEPVWSLPGVRAYVFFLVDPQSQPERQKGEQVWAIGISNEFDDSWERWLYAPNMIVFEIGKSYWKDNLLKLFLALQKFRQTS